MKMAKQTKTNKTKAKQISLKQKPSRHNTQTNKEEWMGKEIIIKLTIVFLVVEILGIIVAKALFLQGLAEAPFTENINDILNAFYLFFVVLVITGIILIVLKIKRTRKMLILLEALAIFTTSTIVLGAFFPTDDILVFLVVTLLLILRYSNRKNIAIRNLVSGIAIAGAGAFLGISLGLLPVLAFAIVLAAYDIIAVFYTKHMVTLGKQSLENNYAFTIAMPTKKHKFELGNGDLVIPLMISASILVNGPFNNNALIAGLCLVASYIGLVLSIYSVAKWKKPMPALPPQVTLTVIVILLGLALGL